MKKTKQKSRMEMTHADWITVYGVGSEKRGAELLKIVRDKIGVKQNEKTFAGFGGGWFFEQFIDRGFRLSTNDEGSAKVELQGLFWTGAVANPFDEFLRLAKLIRTIEGMSWKLTRVPSSPVYKEDTFKSSTMCVTSNIKGCYETLFS